MSSYVEEASRNKSWVEAMDEKMKALKKNDTQDIILR